MKILDKMRPFQKSHCSKTAWIVPACILLFGISMGLFSKYLDYHQAELPTLLLFIDRTLDLHNFLGQLSPWLIIALWISVYSHNPIKAAINVFSFFLGFVASYYLYSYYIAGFFPKSYALIWIGLTFISPFLAYLCWYAKGNGSFAFLLSSGIIGILINTTFTYGMFYIDIRSWLNIIMLIVGIFILHKSLKKTVSMFGIAIVIAIIIKMIIPFNLY